MPGILKLLHNEQVVRCGKYLTEQEKSRLWQSWKSYYGPAWKKAVLIDEPVVDCRRRGVGKKEKSHFKKGTLPAKTKYYSNPRKQYGSNYTHFED